MRRVYLGLGSNLGDRSGNLKKTCDVFRVVKKSRVYETEPFGVKDQPKFLNMAIEIETDLSPRDLLKKCKEVELKIGRKKREKWGPREIDIDILFYGDELIDEDDLRIPHHGICDRKFVLEPLNEIAGEFAHPVSGKRIKELLELL